MKRVALTPAHIETPTGKALLQLTVESTKDGRLDLPEIKALRNWLRENRESDIPAVPYLHDIMTRIAADGVIDRDELIELHLAIERVIPTELRAAAKESRRGREAIIKERIREKNRAAKAAERARLRDERERAAAEEEARRNRLRHEFAKVAGVTFDNDDGTDRQTIIRKCRRWDPIRLEHEPGNPYSSFATKVLWESKGFFGRSLLQIGYAPEYLAERICEAAWTDMKVHGVIKNTTGGTPDKPTKGVNIVVIYSADDVSEDERTEYVEKVMADEQ